MRGWGQRRQDKPVADIKCVKGHQLPQGFHHGPEETREPCPTCGSTARSLRGAAALSATSTLTVGGSVRPTGAVTLTAKGTLMAGGRPPPAPLRRPEAEATRRVVTYTVSCERLSKSWLVMVSDQEGECLGGGVADDNQDAALAAAFAISEGLDQAQGT